MNKTMVHVTDIHEVNAERIGLLIECCIQTYNTFSDKDLSHCERARVTVPDGFELLDCWSGVDSVFGRDETVETYGLVFRSSTAPWRYVFNQIGSYSGSWGAICCRQVEGYHQKIASAPAIMPKRLILLCKKAIYRAGYWVSVNKP